MPATPGTTTIEVPLPMRVRLALLRTHPRQPYHEVIARAIAALEARTGMPGMDATVAKHRDALRVAARRNHLDRIWLFGSRSRGVARPDSDVDLLYRATRASLFDVASFLADAEDILGLEVDLADIDHLPAVMSAGLRRRWRFDGPRLRRSGPRRRGWRGHPRLFPGGKARFLQNDMVRAAVERQFGIMGRAAARVSPATQAQHPSVPWRSLTALSDLLERATAPTDPEKLWLAVSGPLKETLAALRPGGRKP